MTTPPFTGSIEFKLAIEACDVRVVRKARANYAYAPAWPDYDVMSRKERISDPQLDVGLSVPAQPRLDTSRTSDQPAKRYWVPVSQLLTIDILSTPVHDQLRRSVDSDARDADRRYWARAGSPVPPLP
jgi:hypothetical protein